MAQTYSVYEAKARFSEIIRKVRMGQRVIISYRGQEVAEVRPVETARRGLPGRLRQWEEEGLIAPAGEPTRPLRPLARRPGALKRFVESRE